MKATHGFILPLILFSTAVVGALLAHLFQLWIQERERFQSSMKRLAYESETSESLKEELLKARESSRWISPPMLWSSAFPEQRDRFLNALVLKKRARIGKGPLPDWKYLRTHLRDDYCRDMSQSEIEVSSSSAQTCRSLRAFDSHDVFIPANLDVPVLKLNSAASKDTQVIAVAGSLNIGSLLLNDSQRTINIIAIGNIDIQKLVGSSNLKAQLFLSSIKGKILLHEFTKVDTCGSSEILQTRLGLEGAGGILLAGEELRANIYGCEIEHTGLIWPETQIIGSPS